jgi:hypothetical protein
MVSCGVSRVNSLTLARTPVLDYAAIMPSARDRAASALGNALKATAGAEAVDAAGYATSLEQNLLEPLGPSVKQAFEGGAGGELRSKMRAAHSSSALAVNVFSPWLVRLSGLELGGVTGFERVAFEKECHTGLAGTAPHLDLVLERKNMVVGVESKCLEYFTPKVAQFADSYRGIADGRATSRWFRHVLADNYPAQHLDVAQLVKHFLGLAREYEGRDVVLLYLYWEPENWRAIPECVDHRAEVEAFAYSVVGQERVRFASLSYPALWTDWAEGASADGWLRDHVARLRARYAVQI